MSVSFEFDASARSTVGKAEARRMRAKEDRVPAILYGAGKEPMPISLAHKAVLKALEQEAVYSHILTVKVDGHAEKAVLKAIERHPTKPKIMHMDFMRIDAKAKIIMSVPLHFLGEAKSPGVKDGGLLSKLITHFEVSCLPADLPEFIEIDISGLNIGDSIHVSQIAMPEKVAHAHKIDEDHDQVVVSIHEPRAEEPEETAAPVAVETVITGQKAEGEEEAEAAEKK